MKIHCAFFRVNDTSNFRMFSNVVISQHHALCIATGKFELFNVFSYRIAIRQYLVVASVLSDTVGVL